MLSYSGTPSHEHILKKQLKDSDANIYEKAESSFTFMPLVIKLFACLGGVISFK